ncbi:MAG: HNH endonuclease [Gammaproteobacteria bacterium]|nr:HNH endonuclease [Gammaproteobacteria bacterium]
MSNCDTIEYRREYYAKKRFGSLENKLNAFERDGYMCVKCNMTMDQHLEKYNCQLTVDHIDGNGRNSHSPNNDLNNLMTLCLSCHGKKDSTRADYSKRKSYKNENHPGVKLKNNDVIGIRKMRELNFSYHAIKDIFKVSLTHVFQICTNKSRISEN